MDNKLLLGQGSRLYPGKRDSRHTCKGCSDKRGHQKCYKTVPKSIVKSEIEGTSVEKWQREWDQTTKGKTTKEYFPVVADRLKMEINITENFTSMVAGHGNIRSYSHRFKIIETPMCPCSTKEQNN